MSLPNVLLDRVGSGKKRKDKPVKVTFPGAAAVRHAPDTTLRERIATECMKLDSGGGVVCASIMMALSIVEKGVR